MPHKRRKFSDRQATRDFAGKDFAPSGPLDISKEALPKGKMNILNAGKIQAAYHERKRKEKEQAEKRSAGAEGLSAKAKGKAKATDDGEDPNNLRIRQGEKLRDFNARVEQAFAPTISAAARSASKHSQNAKKRKRRKDGTAGDSGDEDAADEGTREKRKANALQAEAREKREREELREQRKALSSAAERDFAAPTQKRNVRDVVMAPPTLTAGKFSKASAGTAADRPGKRMQRDAEADAAKRAQQRILDEERERVISTYRERKATEQKQRLGIESANR